MMCQDRFIKYKVMHPLVENPDKKAAPVGRVWGLHGKSLHLSPAFTLKTMLNNNNNNKVLQSLRNFLLG